MGYSTEATGSMVAFLARNLERRVDDPSSFLEGLDLRRGLKALGISMDGLLEDERTFDSDPTRMLRDLTHREHRPAKEPWACRVDTKEVVYRYPHPFEVMEQAKEKAKGKTSEDSYTAADLIREHDVIVLLGRITRAMNRKERAIRPRARVANKAWLLGDCAGKCGHRVEYGDPILWLNGRVWHQGCEEAA